MWIDIRGLSLILKGTYIKLNSEDRNTKSTTLQLLIYQINNTRSAAVGCCMRKVIVDALTISANVQPASAIAGRGYYMKRAEVLLAGGSWEMILTWRKSVRQSEQDSAGGMPCLSV